MLSAIEHRSCTVARAERDQLAAELREVSRSFADSARQNGGAIRIDLRDMLRAAQRALNDAPIPAAVESRLREEIARLSAEIGRLSSEVARRHRNSGAFGRRGRRRR